ncbi:protein P21-like protein [Cinnamomum micranthum f. kanehirae]|uniref:Protein P21-like protein n=1 Tax=Cinnamomum micranthum f. kanehirae TaxID=337451 RepID=A0A3S3NXN9_9MAGN|nr:protein P21-like protein [Cinnamomum micranthum f. kanehirae]
MISFPSTSSLSSSPSLMQRPLTSATNAPTMYGLLASWRWQAAPPGPVVVHHRQPGHREGPHLGAHRLHLRHQWPRKLQDRHAVSIPMEFSPTSGRCKVIRCVADIKGQCPVELKANDGCNNPYTVNKTNEYCCNSGSCGTTLLSKCFKERCVDAYSYPQDDPTNLFTSYWY